MSSEFLLLPYKPLRGAGLHWSGQGTRASGCDCNKSVYSTSVSLKLQKKIFRITNKEKTPQPRVKPHALLTLALPLPVLIEMKLKSLVGNKVKEIPAYLQTRHLSVPLGTDPNLFSWEPI